MKPELVDRLICGHSMMTGQAWREENLNSLVDLISAETEKELETLKAENARYREALEFYADDESGTDDCSVARRALKGE